MADPTKKGSPSSPLKTATDFATRTARAASNAASTASTTTLALASAALQALPASSTSSTKQPLPSQNYSRYHHASIDPDARGIIRVSSTGSIDNEAEAGSPGPEPEPEPFEEINTIDLSREDRKKRREMLRRQREQEKVNRVIDSLDDAFAPTVVVKDREARGKSV